jgi:hypothetical protein
MSLTIRFYEILNGVVELKYVKNNFYLTEEKYNIFLREVKVAKSVNVKKKTVHYRQFKRFDIVNITSEKKLIVLIRIVELHSLPINKWSNCTWTDKR